MLPDPTTGAKRLSNALQALGVEARRPASATMAWNTARHIEAWYGIMGIGAVCHTLNPRLFADQICYIMNHAEDKIVFVDLPFLPILWEHRERLPLIEKIVVMTDRAHMHQAEYPGALCYEESHRSAFAGRNLGRLRRAERAAALCYTSGTTGNPKGVLYEHRSTFLHTLVSLQADAMGLSSRDTVLAVVPMYHANAWGLNFSVPAAGSKFVLPGSKLDGASIYELLETEQVTFSAAVPTVWQMLLQHMRADNLELSTLKRVVIGGSAVPEAIVRAFRRRLWRRGRPRLGHDGNLARCGTLSTATAAVAAMSPDDQLHYKLKQGRPPAGVELKLTDDDGNRLPHDGTTFGRLKVRGPFIVGQRILPRRRRATSSTTRAISTPATSRPSTRSATCRSPTVPRT